MLEIIFNITLNILCYYFNYFYYNNAYYAYQSYSQYVYLDTHWRLFAFQTSVGDDCSAQVSDPMVLSPLPTLQVKHVSMIETFKQTGTMS